MSSNPNRIYPYYRIRVERVEGYEGQYGLAEDNWLIFERSVVNLDIETVIQAVSKAAKPIKVVVKK